MDLDPSSKAMRFNTVFYHAYLFRYVDMCDTFFFIMRKKYRNVNALQVGDWVPTFPFIQSASLHSLFIGMT